MKLRPTLLFALVLAAPLAADEGMWTFDNPPLKRLQEAYGFTPGPQWLEKLRLASVRFNDGGSGSFVSADGLMLTNHHVGLNCVQNLSTPENDYVAKGYLAPARDQEPACPGYEVNVLTAIEDVTARVLGAVKPAMPDAEARLARQAASARVEKECSQRTGQRCDVVTLYQGSEFHLYTYKKYTDVRLVFAPEQQIAFYGGDPDNFTFPRHDLDICFFRAYENGQPAKPAAWLPWSAGGVKEGDLVFVAGHPGSTSRLRTLAELETLRDVSMPLQIRFARRRLAMLLEYAARGPEQARRAKDQIFYLGNSLKANDGYLVALRDAKLMAGKAAREKELRASATDKQLAGAWDAIAITQKKAAAKAAELRLINFGGSRLLGIAGTLLRYPVEKAKPNEVRFEEFRDSNLASLENQLYSRAPVFEDLEEAGLALQLAFAVEEMGKDHPYLKAVLGGKSPAEVAREALAGTALKDVAARKALAVGGAAAVDASTDSLIVLARKIDPFSRSLRKWREDEVDAVVSRNGEKIAQARWKAWGKTVNPDATFTLRLSYGTVRSYPAEGTQIAPFTTFHGLYDRATSWGGKAPWNLPQRFLEKKAALDLATPLNFVSTADIIGGSSGSPTVDRNGEFVGIVFDGNIQSLALNYAFTEDQARAVSTDSRGILEALKRVYEASDLVEELTRR